MDWTGSFQLSGGPQQINSRPGRRIFISCLLGTNPASLFRLVTLLRLLPTFSWHQMTVNQQTRQYCDYLPSKCSFHYLYHNNNNNNLTVSTWIQISLMGLCKSSPCLIYSNTTMLPLQQKSHSGPQPSIAGSSWPPLHNPPQLHARQTGRGALISFSLVFVCLDFQLVGANSDFKRKRSEGAASLQGEINKAVGTTKKLPCSQNGTA